MSRNSALRLLQTKDVLQRSAAPSAEMKCLKVDEYIKRLATAEETALLIQDLEKYVTSARGLQGRTLCDRVIRACNNQLGAGSPDCDHVEQLVKLVALSLRGYDASAAVVPQSVPLYMEKIIFHIVNKLNSLKAHNLCSYVAGLLYSRLTPPQQAQEYTVLVQSCFSVLWNGLCAAKDGKILNPRDKLHCQMQALSFLLLLSAESATSPISKAPIYAEDAVTEFESSSGTVTEEGASFLLREVRLLFDRCRAGGQGCEGNASEQYAEKSRVCVLSEMLLVVVKVLCKAGLYDLASTSLSEIEGEVRGRADSPWTPLLLAKRAVKVHSTMKAGKDGDQALTECARALRSLSDDLGDREAHAVLEGCQLVVWAVENSRHEALSGPVLLAWFSFLEEQQERILKTLKKNPTWPPAAGRLQQALCFSLHQGFMFAEESMSASKLENGGVRDRVLLYCNAAASQMVTEVHTLASESFFIKAVVAVSNFACGLYNRRCYDQAFALAEILCRGLCKNNTASLSVERLRQPFMLAVQSSRRSGHLERALDWVILWLKALGDKMPTHMAEPVSLWVKTKTDAARNSEEDVRLRTLRDGFGPHVPDEGVMLRLLEEELRAYKEAAGDTAQERYNTLCDLLDICHEGSSHTHLRAVYLCEMAQVVCFQDFSAQTDCSAADFTHEALRLLEEEPETAENADRLKDDKAHALLWLYICTLEKNLQEAIEKDAKLRELREQTRCVADPIETNDFDYEDKQKAQDSILVYEGLHLNLAAENKLCKPLERALDEWSVLLKSGAVPSVRNPRHTCSSLALTAALFRLTGKTLKALEAYQLAAGLSRRLADDRACASSLCQSAGLLLDIGAPELALAQLEQAEKYLTSDAAGEGPSPLSMLAILLKAQYCYSTGQVERGLPRLCEVLEEAGKQKPSKSWYLLRARALQTCSSYLSLDAASLPQAERGRLAQHGINSPDTALYESLRLFCCLLATLVGKGLYGTYSSGSDVRFVDQGDNVALKWQLLSELLNCSVKVVAVRSSCGAVGEARLQCLEALKLAIKLQAPSLCAELLVMKAELELMQGEREESGIDLDKVRNLLELCTDFSDQVQKAEVKIKPRKGRPVRKPQSPPTTAEDDLKGILSTRWIAKEPVVSDPASSPPLKAQPRRWLSSLTHESDCRCPCCSEPCLVRATSRWAAAQADLILQLDPCEAKVSLKLQRAALARCESATAKLGAKLAELFPPRGPTKGSPKPSLMQDVVGRVYLRLALSGLEPKFNKVCAIWNVLEAGLAFADSTPSPVLGPVKAGLTAIKAIVSLITLASREGRNPDELFANAWAWNSPKELKSEPKTTPPSSLLKKSTDSVKIPDIPDKAKEAKSIKVAKPKIQASSSSTRGKILVPMTPVPVKPKSSLKELSCFDFNTAVPTLACTPVQKVKAPASAQKAARTGPKLQFHVYEEESSPGQEKAQPVPAAPRRTKKSRFKVEFSDESEPEAAPRAELKEKTDVPKKRATAARAARGAKKAPDPPAEKILPKRLARGKKSTTLPRSTSSEDDEALACQPAPARRGRTKGKPSRTEAAAAVAVAVAEEPDKMRTIEEETHEVLDMSVEQLGTSDTEPEDHPAPKIDFEVLRRDTCGRLERGDPSELRSRGHPRGGPQRHLPRSDPRPENLSVEDVEVLLRSAWLALQHFPPPAVYPTLCALLALTLGQRDPVTTAMLHAQSLGVTSRHATIRHLASCLKKLRKSSNELADKMDTLSLNEPSETESKASTIKRLAQLENIYAFPTADCSTFPQNHCQEFMRQLQHLPRGVTVCVMSVLGVKPGEIGDGVLLTRLEKGSAPVTVHFSTSRQQHPVSWLVQEMDGIQAEQKVVSCSSDKVTWWEGRKALDSRLEQLLKKMEGLLGCWKSFLLPLSSDAQLSIQAQRLCKALSARGVTSSEEMLKVVLSAFPSLSKRDIQSFTHGLSPQWDAECDQLLHAAACRLSERDEPGGHVVLILDKHLQKLPWESISLLKSCSVSRMPSLHSLIGLSVQKESDTRSVLLQGVDPKKVFYVLDPDANLGYSQSQFREWFSKLEWDGVCGVAPDSGQLEEAVATNDLYIYVGHGAGVRILNSQAILKRQMRAASLVFGCSSAALSVRGDQEGQGIILSYLMAGCPLFLGNLWDVTDRDSDRLTKFLLESWLSAGSGASLLDYMSASRQATCFKHLTGAAAVVYGLPVHLH